MQGRILEVAIQHQRRLAGIERKCDAEVKRHKAAAAPARHRGHHDGAVVALGLLDDLGADFPESAHCLAFAQLGVNYSVMRKRLLVEWRFLPHAGNGFAGAGALFNEFRDVAGDSVIRRLLRTYRLRRNHAQGACRARLVQGFFDLAHVKLPLPRATRQ